MAAFARFMPCPESKRARTDLHEGPESPGWPGHLFSINASPRSRAYERVNESNQTSFRRELMQSYTNQFRKSAEWNFYLKRNEILFFQNRIRANIGIIR